MNPGRLTLFAPLFAALILALPSAAHAEPELRLYMSASADVLRHGELKLSPMASVENHLHSGQGLNYSKWTVGAGLGLLQWLSVSLYYQRIDSTPQGKPRHFENLAGADLALQVKPGDWWLRHRSGNEWHVSDGYYRYRGLFEAGYRLPLEWLRLYASEEFRIDSDQGRVNQNDIQAGIEIVPRPSLALRVFADRQSTRRAAPQWSRQDYLGVSMGAHF